MVGSELGESKEGLQEKTEIHRTETYSPKYC